MTLDPIRLLVTTAVLALVSCNGDDTKDTGDTGTTDSGHPLVPDGYEYAWDTDGCDDGGANVYTLAEGRSDDGVDIEITETWYWFFGNEDYEGDCVDTFEFTGTATDYSWSTDPCSECEEEYTGTYAEKEMTCGIGYGSLITGEGSSESYDVTFMFDTLTAAGNPNQENRMLVIQIGWDGNTATAWDPNWATGHAEPDTEGDYGGPTTYDWANAGRCIQFSR